MPVTEFSTSQDLPCKGCVPCGTYISGFCARLKKGIIRALLCTYFSGFKRRF